MYHVAMATQRSPKLTARTVVTLNPEEKQALQRRAREERVSASEVMRRSFRAYNKPEANEDEEAMKFLLREMNDALDRALETSRSARVEIDQNLSLMRERRRVEAAQATS